MRTKGRPKGAKSTVRVKLKDLRKYLTDDATVMVGTTWLEEIGFGIDESALVKLIAINKPTKTEEKVDVQDLNLDE